VRLLCSLLSCTPLSCALLSCAFMCCHVLCWAVLCSYRAMTSSRVMTAQVHNTDVQLHRVA
jgi:hypothetical protein